jgi:hypothetical protein
MEKEQRLQSQFRLLRLFNDCCVNIGTCSVFAKDTRFKKDFCEDNPGQFAPGYLRALQTHENRNYYRTFIYSTIRKRFTASSPEGVLNLHM